MIPVYWHSKADQELEDIVDYISINNLEAALKLGNMIIDYVDTYLPKNPKMGRPGRVENTRELVVHKNYIVVYRLTSSRIDILSIRHTAQLWPSHF